MPHKHTRFIDNLIEHAANVGYQHSNRFIVLLQGPSLATIQDFSLPRRSVGTKKMIDFDSQKRLALSCQSVTVPGKSLSTKEWSGVGSGPKTLFPYSETYTNEITLEFLCSTDMFERNYFTKWLYHIIDPNQNDVAHYSDYAQPHKLLVVFLPADIQNFGSVQSILSQTNETNQVRTEGVNDDSEGYLRALYYIRLHDVYPSEISENVIRYDDKNSILHVAVKMKYRYWDDPLTTYLTHVWESKNTDLGIQSFAVGRDISDPHIAGKSDQVGKSTIKDSPFSKFTKILRDIARYTDPKEFRQLVVDQGLGHLGDIIGVQRVEQIAQAGQVVDVFSKSHAKGYKGVQGRLIGPLGNIIR